MQRRPVVPELFLSVAHPVPSLRWLAIAGYLAGVMLYFRLRRRWPVGPGVTLRQGAWLVMGMLAGSLLGFLAVRVVESMHGLWVFAADTATIPGSAASLGGAIGGWCGMELTKKAMRLGYPSGDAFVFPLMLALSISRLGQMLLPSGLPTSLPWGMAIADGITRHPVHLYEIACLLGIAAIFLHRVLRHRQRGCMFSQFVFAYLAIAFLIDFFRQRYILAVIPLSMQQLVMLGGMTHALVHWNDECCGKPKAGATSAPPAGPEWVELTNSLCTICLNKIEAKVLIESGAVYLQKFCPDHGLQKVLIADDVPYWREARALYKPPTSPLRRNTAMRRGCPHDCGICPDHEQHSCLAIIEVTDQCDLGCPVCYARSSAGRSHRTLAEIEFMLDSAVANEGTLNVVQISGGEPTLHPEFFAILDAVRRRPIRHMMLNTNGKRLATDREFVKRLSTYLPRFEVYLQFDSLRAESLKQIRGADLTDVRKRALDALDEAGISTCLVVTLVKGINDGEVGEIIDYAASRRCVRGVTFQPLQAAGRLVGVRPETSRLTLTEVRRAIIEQSSLFCARDIVPVPCHTDALAMGYALRVGSKLMPLSKLVDPRALLNIGGNTICYEQDPRIRDQVMRLFSASASPASAADSINELCCEPDVRTGGFSYDKVFRVVIMQFMDAWNMDLRSLKRSCVHIVHPDGRLIPFETYNLFYRNSGSHGPSASISAAEATARPPLTSVWADSAQTLDS